MNKSIEKIHSQQDAWAAHISRDEQHPAYAATLAHNLFLNGLQQETEAEFRHGDGSELDDARTWPAKMRAFVSSSALAVNFFDAWRDSQFEGISAALSLPFDPATVHFEYKPKHYPVKPRSPNLDLLLTLANGDRVGVESKFAEPYRAPGEGAIISSRYFRENVNLWAEAGLKGAQTLATALAPKWLYLDVAQLLKHMLGLAHDEPPITHLLYLWYDPGTVDGSLHRSEISQFGDLVRHDRVKFSACSYQEVFARLRVGQEPRPGWYRYMQERYFNRGVRE